MRSFKVLFSFLILSSSLSFAAQSVTTQKQNKMKDYLKQNNISVSVFFATADSMGFGASAQIQKNMASKTDWYAQVSFEQERELAALSAQQRPSFRPLIMSGGLFFNSHKSEKFYYMLGLNYPLFTETRNMEMKAELGWQAFAAMKLKKELSLEAGWRELRYDVSSTSSLRGLQSFGGVSLAGRYSF